MKTVLNRGAGLRMHPCVSVYSCVSRDGSCASCCWLSGGVTVQTHAWPLSTSGWKSILPCLDRGSRGDLPCRREESSTARMAGSLGHAEARQSQRLMARPSSSCSRESNWAPCHAASAHTLGRSVRTNKSIVLDRPRARRRPSLAPTLLMGSRAGSVTWHVVQTPGIHPRESAPID